jgi:hypothetical protein
MDLWETVSYKYAIVLSTLRQEPPDDIKLLKIIKGITTVHFTTNTPPDTPGMDTILGSIN